jgi:hypothetical protein
MDINLHSSGNSTINVHSVSKILVVAESTISNDGKPLYWQDLVFLRSDGLELGRVTAYLESPEAALPVGDQPPYWGIDQSKALVVIDGEAPF